MLLKRWLLPIYVLITFVIISLAGLASINPYTSPSYDHLSITPDTWQKIDLTYTETIEDKKYPGEIKLLRPKTWLIEKKKKHNICPPGNPIYFSIPELGIHGICAKVTQVKPITLDTFNVDWSKQHSRPVIGTFKRYASVVNTYAFKDKAGEITRINATPNHPFYIENKKAFIPIEDVSPTDQLITETGQFLQLLCPKNRENHCGKRYNQNGKLMPVYNLEVYQQHVYYIGKEKILVHNVCDWIIHDRPSTMDMITQQEVNPDSASVVRLMTKGDNGKIYVEDFYERESIQGLLNNRSPTTNREIIGMYKNGVKEDIALENRLTEEASGGYPTGMTGYFDPAMLVYENEGLRIFEYSPDAQQAYNSHIQEAVAAGEFISLETEGGFHIITGVPSIFSDYSLVGYIEGGLLLFRARGNFFKWDQATRSFLPYE